MNDQDMYNLSTPTHPDHLADITAGQRSPVRTHTEVDPGYIPTQAERDANDALYAATFTEEQLSVTKPLTTSANFTDALAGSEAFHQALTAKLTERQAPVRPEYIAGSRTDPYGMRFPWGPITEQHQIGNYTILEFLEDTSTYNDPVAWARHGRTLYHVYVDGKNTSVSALSLDAALAGAIAYRREGPNSHAGDYFMRMVGGD
jgi:hypothetical protein